MNGLRTAGSGKTMVDDEYAFVGEDMSMPGMVAGSPVAFLEQLLAAVAAEDGCEARCDAGWKFCFWATTSSMRTMMGLYRNERKQYLPMTLYTRPSAVTHKEE